MITDINISNVVLIERLGIEFKGGLCALTGETGAGKSILLDSVGLSLGNRASSSLVGKKSEQSSVSLGFSLPRDHPALIIAKEHGIDSDDGAIILKRIIGKDGKSKAFANDVPVSVNLLKMMGETLVEFHGQFDNHKLLNPSTHRKIIDDYAKLDKELKNLSICWNNWKNAEKDLEEAKRKAEKAKEDEEYLTHVVKELKELSPEKGEEERLSEIKTKLQNKERILEALNNAYKCLCGDGGADSMLQKSFRLIDRGTQNAGDTVNQVLEAIDRAMNETNEAVSMIDNICADLMNDDENLEFIDDRLHELKAAARKHQCLVDDLPEKLEELSEQLKYIHSQDDILSDLAEKCKICKENYIKQAEKVSKVRKDAALKIDKEMSAELPPLKLENAKFKTEIIRKEQSEWNENGIDKVEFLISTNPNSAFGSLNKIASGGEMARFMLALKVVMAEIGSACTLIFDEVDTGIGGAVADAVGERLAKLAKNKQILVVTHSPQVASRADNHWHVSKNNSNDGVVTSISSLDNHKERKEEIARMLSGANITKEARAAAEKLLQAAG